MLIGGTSMKKSMMWAVTLFLVSGGAVANAKHAITFDDLMKVQRISDPQVSPDGRWVAYVQGAVDFEANKIPKHLWLVPAGGGVAHCVGLIAQQVT